MNCLCRVWYTLVEEWKDICVGAHPDVNAGDDFIALTSLILACDGAPPEERFVIASKDTGTGDGCS